MSTFNFNAVMPAHSHVATQSPEATELKFVKNEGMWSKLARKVFPGKAPNESAKVQEFFSSCKMFQEKLWDMPHYQRLTEAAKLQATVDEQVKTPVFRRAFKKDPSLYVTYRTLHMLLHEAASFCDSSIGPSSKPNEITGNMYMEDSSRSPSPTRRKWDIHQISLGHDGTVMYPDPTAMEESDGIYGV